MFVRVIPSSPNSDAGVQRTKRQKENGLKGIQLPGFVFVSDFQETSSNNCILPNDLLKDDLLCSSNCLLVGLLEHVRAAI